MDIVLVKERGTIRVLEGEGTVTGKNLAMRSRLTGGNLQYYVLDYDESRGMSLNAYIAAINKHPNLLEKSKMIKRI